MPYTDKRMLRAIMKNYKEGAQMSGRNDILEFLSWVSEHYRHVFQESRG